MNSHTKYKILKLKSGEEIIARIKNSTKTKLSVERPMCFRSFMIQDHFGNPKEILIMKNWIPLSVENSIDIPVDHVVSFMNPNPDAIKLYETEKEKEDVKGKITQFKDEASEEEEFKKMMKYLSDNTEKLDDLMKDIENAEKENSKEKPKNSKEDMIFMNMMFPPEMLVDLIESEIIDPEIFGEMYEDIKKSKKKKKPASPKGKKQEKTSFEGNSGKYTGDQKNRKDYGNKWTDWNPDLSSEEYQ